MGQIDCLPVRPQMDSRTREDRRLSHARVAIFIVSRQVGQGSVEVNDVAVVCSAHVTQAATCFGFIEMSDDCRVVKS
jgi:hypothetical protein